MIYLWGQHQRRPLTETDKPVSNRVDIVVTWQVKGSSFLLFNILQVLKQRNKISELAQSVVDNPTFSELKADFNDNCEFLIQEFQDLERHVNASVLQLIVSTFKETTEPMERLVRAALSPQVCSLLKRIIN